MNPPEIDPALLIPLAVAGLVISVIINSIFLFISARVLGMSEVSFGKAILTTLAICFIPAIIGFAGVFLLLPLMGASPVLGMVVLMCLVFFSVLLIIKTMFDCSYGQAFVVWLVSIVINFFISACISLAAAVLDGSYKVWLDW
ncbi:MAG: hypothetical protein JW739_03390 [Opitutales bacterium]|nr:hypothetical protein [Opitutales bacterium]